MCTKAERCLLLCLLLRLLLHLLLRLLLRLLLHTLLHPLLRPLLHPLLHPLLKFAIWTRRTSLSAAPQRIQSPLASLAAARETEELRAGETTRGECARGPPTAGGAGVGHTGSPHAAWVSLSRGCAHATAGGGHTLTLS